MNGVRRRMMVVAGAAVITLGLVYIGWPVGHIPAYDANLVRLAESDLQGYCSGEAFWRSQGAGSASMAAECRARLKRQRSNVPNLTAVQGAFCVAIVRSGWGGSRTACLTIMADNRYWPTYDGGITNQWNHARPYPQALFAGGVRSKPGGSRTGGRGDGGRRNPPTHRVPRYP